MNSQLRDNVAQSLLDSCQFDLHDMFDIQDKPVSPNQSLDVCRRLIDMMIFTLNTDPDADASFKQLKTAEFLDMMR